MSELEKRCKKDYDWWAKQAGPCRPWSEHKKIYDGDYTRYNFRPAEARRLGTSLGAFAT